MKFIKDCGSRCKYFQCRCQKKKYTTGDCVVRAIAIASDIDYLEVWNELHDRAKIMGYLPNTKEVYEPYLFDNRFIKSTPMRNSKGRKVRLKDIDRHDEFTDYHSYIFLTSGHLTAVVNGVHRDTWNCQAWCTNSYYIRRED